MSSKVIVPFPRKRSRAARDRIELFAARQREVMLAELRARLTADRDDFLAKAKQRRASRAFWWRQIREAVIAEVDTTVGDGLLRVTFQIAPVHAGTS